MSWCSLRLRRDAGEGGRCCIRKDGGGGRVTLTSGAREANRQGPAAVSLPGRIHNHSADGDHSTTVGTVPRMTQTMTQPTTHRLRASILVVVAAVILAALAAVTVAAVTPCEEEDGSGNIACHWDAKTRGNGEGTSFWAFGYGRWII